MSAHSSQASAVSISDSSGPECESCSSANKTSGAEASSPNTGRMSPASRTLFISENQRAEVLLTTYARQLTVGGGKPGQGYPAVLISSAEDSPAKTSPSQADEQDSTVPAPDSSSSSPGSQMSLYAQEDGSSLRTSPACSLPPVDEISRSFSARWATSGFTTSPGECWTADTSECPSAGDASSSLGDVLLATVPERFFLSPRAAAGILRRAAKRGRELPRPLAEALMDLASQHQDDAKRTMRTSSGSLMAAEAQVPSELSKVGDTTSTPTEQEPVLSTLFSTLDLLDLGGTTTQPLSPIRSEQRDSTPARTEPAAEPRSSVRRLTPTECERLQSFPDGWTIPGRTVPDMQRWGTQ
jgi:hypothetical protein